MSEEPKRVTHPVGKIAKLLMLTDRRVQQLAAEGVIPKSERGRYEIEPVVQAYIRYLQERSVNPAAMNSGAGPIDYAAEKARLTKAQADIAEVELATTLGELAPVKEFEKAQSRIFATIRANIMNVPQRVVVQLIGETDELVFKQKLRAELTLALESSANADLSDDDFENEDVV